MKSFTTPPTSETKNTDKTAMIVLSIVAGIIWIAFTYLTFSLISF